MKRHMTSHTSTAQGRFRPRRESGVFAIMFIPLVLVMLAFSALAIELGLLYNRIADLHGMAKAAAVSAALKLDGTAAGIANAKENAKTTTESLRYKYFGKGVAFTWTDAALTFSAQPDRSGTWLDGGSAADQAGNLFYAKVDTSSLVGAMGTVDTILAKVLSASLALIQVKDSAVAGRTTIGVVPIAICAMGAKATARTHTLANGSTVSELVQYGFRRGVSYDLMQLNPNGTDPARFGVNPVVAPGGASAPFYLSSLPRFACAGAMWVPRVTGGSIRVSPLATVSPLSDLHIALNSRFDKYTGGPCDPSGAPPDYNIKAYAYDVANGVKWMSPSTGSPSAATTKAQGRLETVADLTTPPGSAGAYGPLWAYAKAVKAPNPASAPEPANGYVQFALSDWPVIYKSGPTAPNYPTTSATPYLALSGSNGGNYAPPSSGNSEISTLERRVLNIPLLLCTPSAPSGTNAQATVSAVGKFFMTVPATKDSLIAEFAGLVPETSLSSQVELFP
jgi:hypothetical protein